MLSVNSFKCSSWIHLNALYELIQMLYVNSFKCSMHYFGFRYSKMQESISMNSPEHLNESCYLFVAFVPIPMMWLLWFNLSFVSMLMICYLWFHVNFVSVPMMCYLLFNLSFVPMPVMFLYVVINLSLIFHAYDVMPSLFLYELIQMLSVNSFKWACCYCAHSNPWGIGHLAMIILFLLTEALDT
jgi:hypothetical protein